MHTISLLAALMTLSAGSCDPARFAGPASESSAAKADPRLNGVWSGQSASHEPIFLHVLPHATGEVDLVLVGSDAPGAMVLHYQGQATAVNGLNLLSLRSKHFADPLENKFELSAEWTWAKYELGKDGSLLLSCVTNEGMSHAIAAGTLVGVVTTGGGARVTDTPAKVIAYLAQSKDKTLWSVLERLHPLKTP